MGNGTACLHDSLVCCSNMTCTSHSFLFRTTKLPYTMQASGRKDRVAACVDRIIPVIAPDSGGTARMPIAAVSVDSMYLS